MPVALLLSLAAAQETAPPASQQGLATAPAVRKYEPPPANASAGELEKTGDELRATRAFPDSLDYYRAAMAKAPGKAEQAVLYNKMGIAELQQEHLKEARKNFERALKRDNKYAEALNNLGAVFHKQKKYGKAEKYYRKAIGLQDANASFHSNLGTAYFMDKKYEPAMVEYRRALELDPEVFERSSRIGISAQLSTSENRAQYNYMVAKLYAQMGDFEKSIEYLKKALEEGYKEINNVYKDQKFAGLRKDPRFTELMATRPASISE
jgi:tetratricopeptide (TPR) repeat protein